MGLLEQEISEIRNMAKDVMSGKLTPEMAAVQIGFFNQTSKRVSQMIQIAGLTIKEGKNSKAYSRMVNANIIGDGLAIQIEAEHEELIKCPELGGRCIGRNDCLDYSGESRHIDACQKCDQFTTTRKQLAPS